MFQLVDIWRAVFSTAVLACGPSGFSTAVLACGLVRAGIACPVVRLSRLPVALLRLQVFAGMVYLLPSACYYVGAYEQGGHAFAIAEWCKDETAWLLALSSPLFASLFQPLLSLFAVVHDELHLLSSGQAKQCKASSACHQSLNTLLCCVRGLVFFFCLYSFTKVRKMPHICTLALQFFFLLCVFAESFRFRFASRGKLLPLRRVYVVLLAYNIHACSR